MCLEALANRAGPVPARAFGARGHGLRPFQLLHRHRKVDFTCVVWAGGRGGPANRASDMPVTSSVGGHDEPKGWRAVAARVLHAAAIGAVLPLAFTQAQAHATDHRQAVRRDPGAAHAVVSMAEAPLFRAPASGLRLASLSAASLNLPTMLVHAGGTYDLPMVLEHRLMQVRCATTVASAVLQPLVASAPALAALAIHYVDCLAMHRIKGILCSSSVNFFLCPVQIVTP